MYIYYKTFFDNKRRLWKTLPLILVLQKFSDITHPTHDQPRNLSRLEVMTLVTGNWKLDLITSDQFN
jgi:hypothetical protein